MIACVGAGYWGKNLVRNFHALGVLSSVAEQDPSIRRALSKEYPDVQISSSLDDLLRDSRIRGVAVATPAATHAEIIRKTLLADKDVYVEKPLCLSVTEGKELVDLASQRGRVLMVGHLLWYHPAVWALKKLVESGSLGPLKYIYSHRLNFGRVRREENVLWSFAPHDISVILGLTGEMPSEVSAHGGNFLDNLVSDVALASLSFPSGVKAHLFVSWLNPFKEQKLVVVGERQMAVFDDVEPEKKLLLYPYLVEQVGGAGLPILKKEAAQVVAFDKTEPLKSECLHFIECVKSRNTPRTDGEEGLRVLTVLDRCQTALNGKYSPLTKTPSVKSAPPDFFAHESSFIDSGVEIGAKTSIWHVSHVLKGSKIGECCRIGQNVVIGPNVVVGNGVKIQNNVSVYEGVTLEDGVFCGPSMVFTNVMNPRSEIPRMHELKSTLVKRGASLGANCTIVCGLTIGEYAFVGAGAVVTANVPAYALVVGVPAVQKGWMCRCGAKLRFRGRLGKCVECKQQYRKLRKEIQPL